MTQQHLHHHEHDHHQSAEHDFSDTHSTHSKSEPQHTVLCCLCGTSIHPNPTSMCFTCLQSQMDITENFAREEILMWCRECERYLQPPKYWMPAELESKELLTLCLKRVKGLQKREIKLVDAKFLWTEPHSRRLKVQITVQKEVLAGAKLQQSFVVEFVVKNFQCDACKTSYTKYDWVASVQVRQKVDHKRTFFFLEQAILKTNQHSDCINIKEAPDGLDFYFSSRSHAHKFKDFICSVSPTHVEVSKQLVTHDTKSNVFNYKHSLSCTLAPLCREDLVCLPPMISSSLGGLGPIALVNRVNQAIHFLDPRTLKTNEISSSMYFKHQFTPVMTSRNLLEFYVLNVEPLESTFAHKKYQLCMAEIVRSDEVGNENEIQFVKTHLGNILGPGDTVLGYDLLRSNFNDVALHKVKKSKIPDVVLVRKVYAKKQNRKFKVKKLPIQQTSSEEKHKDDFERFLDEIEEDEEIRGAVRLFKAKDNSSGGSSGGGAGPQRTLSKKDKRKLKKQQAQEKETSEETVSGEALPDIADNYLESDNEDD
uniref:60S ribosomal export protein NMD3 n=1 Tax=Percolomonas cosmopolitus TaxID=63605 RepID=A0A7S1PHK6_9EUKA|mmetsp:Transcript_5665/g.21350  ORF Transcript_5665/g.21350 Transcript_5665/m.21350 type:complete len:538 (+) Transcript_5665:150-1763(+)